MASSSTIRTRCASPILPTNELNQTPIPQLNQITQIQNLSCYWSVNGRDKNWGRKKGWFYLGICRKKEFRRDYFHCPFALIHFTESLVLGGLFRRKVKLNFKFTLSIFIHVLIWSYYFHTCVELVLPKLLVNCINHF